MTRTVRGLVLALLAGFPVLVVTLANRSVGPALSPDSVSYLATARSWAGGGGLVSFDGQPLTLFPPGLPLLLGSLMASGVPWEAGASVIAAICLVAVVIGTYALGVITLRSGWWALVPAAVVSLSTPLLEVFTWLWTEPPFTAITVWLLVLASWAVRRRAAMWWVVVLAGALTSFAFAFRYAGLMLVPVTVLGVWWAARTLPRHSAFGRTLVATAVSLVVPALVVARNLSQGAGPLGDRYPGSRTLMDALVESIEVLGEVVIPVQLSPLWVLAGAVLIAVGAVSVWAALVDRDRVLGLLAIYVAIYLGSLVWSQSATRLDVPTVRLLTPMIPALAVLVMAGALLVGRRVVTDVNSWAHESPHPEVRRRGARLISLGAATVLVLVGGLWVTHSLVTDLNLARSGTGEVVRGLATSGSASETLLAAQVLADHSALISNDPWSTYLQSGAPTLFLPPRADEWPIERIARDTDRIVDAVRSRGSAYVLILDGAASVQPVTDLSAVGLDVTLVEQTADGSIYRLTSVAG